MLIIIRGLPGSGKTTVAQSLVKKAGFEHFEADMYLVDKDTGEYIHDPRRIRTAHAWCIKQAIAALKAGKDVVVSNTYVQLFEFKAIMKAALDEIGTDVYIHECNGGHKSVHDVPAKKIAQMRRRWESLT